MMLEEFEAYFESLNVKDLMVFTQEARNQNRELQEVAESGDKEAQGMIKFLNTLLGNIEEEIRGVTSFKTVDLKKKIRLYAMIHLFHDVFGENELDEFYDEDDYDDEDEDEDEDDYEEEEEEIEEEDSNKRKKK